MASTEKLGTVGGYKATGLSDVAGIITDAPPSHPVVRQLRDRGATIIQAYTGLGHKARDRNWAGRA